MSRKITRQPIEHEEIVTVEVNYMNKVITIRVCHGRMMNGFFEMAEQDTLEEYTIIDETYEEIIKDTSFSPKNMVSRDELWPYLDALRSQREGELKQKRDLEMGVIDGETIESIQFISPRAK
jgi:hypothetical protein